MHFYKLFELKCVLAVCVKNAPPIYLNAFMFVQIIRDPDSPTEEVSIRFFYESLQIAFLIMCLLASSAAKVNSLMKTAHHPMEERGGVNRAH